MNTYLKINEDSIMFNGKASSELLTQSGRYGNEADCEISLWINGGSAYRFKTSNEAVDKIDALDYRAKEKLAEHIALKVAETIEIEVNKMLSNLK